MTKEHYPCCSELLIASWAISFHPQLIHYSSAVRKWLQPRTFQKACVSTAAQDSTRGSTSTQPGGTPVLGFKEPSEIPHWLSPGGRHVFHNENLDFQRKLGTSQIIPWLKSSDPQHLWYQAGTGFMVHEQEVGAQAGEYHVYWIEGTRILCYGLKCRRVRGFWWTRVTRNDWSSAFKIIIPQAEGPQESPDERWWGSRFDRGS